MQALLWGALDLFVCTVIVSLLIYSYELQHWLGPFKSQMVLYCLWSPADVILPAERGQVQIPGNGTRALKHATHTHAHTQEIKIFGSCTQCSRKH